MRILLSLKNDIHKIQNNNSCPVKRFINYLMILITVSPLYVLSATNLIIAHKIEAGGWRKFRRFDMFIILLRKPSLILRNAPAPTYKNISNNINNRILCFHYE